MSSDSGIDLSKIDLREYVSGGRPDVGKLTQVGAGTIIAALGWGLVNVILGLADIPLAFLELLTSFLAASYELLLSTVALLIRGSFEGAAATVANAGVLGFVLAVAIVGATAFAFSWVISRE